MKLENKINYLVVDLFAGAGGTTTGFAMARYEGKDFVKVIACVNHDVKAIKSHWLNHPNVIHFEEDIRTLELGELSHLCESARANNPDAELIIWASLECTNFSKAKGGLPRDADSRTLADHLHRYVTAITPDYIMIENVVEFMSWGALDDKGKPVSRRNGEDWIKWRNKMCAHGYTDDWREMNSANYGAYTSRNRLFGCFAKPGLPIIFPEHTHAKNPGKSTFFESLKKWKAVKDVLDFSDEGISILERNKPLSEKTLERIHAGLIKYVAKGDTSFISKYYSGKPSGMNIPTEGPAGTITTIDSQAIVNAEFLLKYNSTDKNGNHTPPSIEEPSPVISTQGRLGVVKPVSLFKYSSTDKTGTHYQGDLEQPCPTVICRDMLGVVQGEFITQRNTGEPESKLVDIDGPARTITATGGNQDLVQPEFLAAYYGNGDNVSSVESPAPTIPTKDRCALVQPECFIDKHFNNAQNQSINQPAGTIIMPTNYDNPPAYVEKPLSTITALKRYHYLINPAWGGNPGSVDEPCCVIVARQDKAPLSLLQVEKGSVAIYVYDDDSPGMVKIKQFMVVYGLIDIKMRMLRVKELLKIQGFPDGYHLAGNQADQKKFIGNSVVPHVVKAWIEAMREKKAELEAA